MSNIIWEASDATVLPVLAEHLENDTMDVEMICNGYLVSSTGSPFQTKWVVAPSDEDRVICRLPRRVSGTIHQTSDTTTVQDEYVMTIQIGSHGIVKTECLWTVLWECVGAFALTQWYKRNDDTNEIRYVDETGTPSCTFVKPDLFVLHALGHFGIDLVHELEHRSHLIFKERGSPVLEEWFCSQ